MRRDTGFVRLVVIMLIGAVLLAGCGSHGSASDDEVVVFAAASLTESFNEIKTAFEQEHADIDVTYNFAGSQQLATQLGQGAGADAYASANTVQMQVARDTGRIAGEPVVFAHNRLVIIVPDENPADLNTPADLAQSGTKLVLANEEVPVGKYSRAALDRMSAGDAFGENFRERVEANVVSNESSVKQVVTKVQLGEADAGIVYRTDVTEDIAADVRVIEIPDELNVTADYPIGVVEGGNETLARKFIEFVQSESGQRILMDYGFGSGAR